MKSKDALFLVYFKFYIFLCLYNRIAFSLCFITSCLNIFTTYLAAIYIIQFFNIMEVGDEDMKVRIEINDNTNEEDEVIIRCRVLDENIQRIYDTVKDVTNSPRHLMLSKDNMDYYIPLDSILFFETSDNCISAHTGKNVYKTSYRLYELEDLLPGNFMRVSKSAIVNLNHVYSISRNLTSSSAIQLRNTHKQVFVSRYYYKLLKQRLEEKRSWT